MRLSIEAKLLWIYSITKCNHAGILELNEDLCVFQIGIKKSFVTVRQELGSRWQTLKEDKIFIPKFISYQYPNGLNDNVLAQKSVLKELIKYDLWNDENQTVKQQLNNTCLSVKDIDMDIEQGLGYKNVENINQSKNLTPLQELWNLICLDLPKVKENSNSRKAKEIVRLRERRLEKWKAVFETLNNSDFCKGINDRGWQATYDWIISNDTNAVKVLEGKYNRIASKTKAQESIENMRKLGLIT